MESYSQTHSYDSRVKLMQLKLRDNSNHHPHRLYSGAVLLGISETEANHIGISVCHCGLRDELVMKFE